MEQASTAALRIQLCGCLNHDTSLALLLADPEAENT